MSSTVKYSDVKSLEQKALDAKISELRGELFRQRIQKVAAGLEKPHVLKTIKRDIAKLLTAKNAK